MSQFNSIDFSESLTHAIEKTLDDKRASDIVIINLDGKTDIADYMIIASGNSTTHVGALAEYIDAAFRQHGIDPSALEGRPENEWVLVDTPYVIVHLFKPEVRGMYNLEKMWQADFSNIEIAEKQRLH